MKIFHGKFFLRILYLLHIHMLWESLCQLLGYYATDNLVLIQTSNLPPLLSVRILLHFHLLQPVVNICLIKRDNIFLDATIGWEIQSGGLNRNMRHDSIGARPEYGATIIGRILMRNSKLRQ
jgi:hypothetical protein